jgi:hypothetical protein
MSKQKDAKNERKSAEGVISLRLLQFTRNLWSVEA